MSREMRMGVWLAGIAVTVLLLYLLSDVLLPFVAGMAIAYFLDPVADRLEKWGLSRVMATVLITAAFFVVMIGLLVLLLPLLQAQVVGLVARIPDLIQVLREQAGPLLERLQASLSQEDIQKIGAAAESHAGRIIAWIGGLAGRIWSGGVALVNLLSLLLITPLVSFYLIRDWDRIVDRLNSYLPKDAAPTIHDRMGEIDQTLAGFVRGQATVCLFLGAFYAIGLSLTGLEFGLLVGLGAGLISFIPYFGMIVGLVVALGIAFVQFSDWVPFVMVAAVFGLGQVIEGFFLTPKLVGDKVGLHPVWILFALMAGGALFGFTGVLLAVPAAAVIGVLTRFGLECYRDSVLYHGGTDDAGEGASDR